MAALLTIPTAAVPSEFVSVDSANIVLSRARPEIDAVGVPLGGFRAYPSLTIGVAHDDNVFNLAAPTADDFVDITPHLGIESTWSSNFLRLAGDATFERFTRITSENNDRYSLDAFGRVDISRGTKVEVEGSYARRVEARGSSGDVIGGSRPIVFFDTGALVRQTTTLGALTVLAQLDFDRFRYDPAQVGSQFFAQSYRNNDATVGSVVLSYPLTPEISAVTSIRYNDQSYADQTAGIFALDTHGFAALAGVRFGLTGVTSGQVTVGYLRQTYRAISFPTIAGIAYDARVVWNPTTLLSITASARRTIEPSPMTNVAGIVADGFGATADYELLRDFLIKIHTDYIREAYRGIDRLDRRITAALDFRYLVNRLLEIALRYDFRDQTSHGLGARPYRGSALQLQLKAHL